MSMLHVGRRHDSGDLAGVVSEIASANGAQAGRIITAVRTSQGKLRLISWQVSGSGPITRLADSGSQAGSASSIDIARGRRFVVACRTASGNLKLISWDIDGTGTITRTGDSGDQAGKSTGIKIVAISNTLFVTACRAADGRLLLISWRLNSNDSLDRLGDSAEAAGKIGEVSLLKLPLTNTSERIATSVRTSGGELKVIVWRVSSAGAFTRLGDSADQAGQATMIRSALDPAERVVTSVRTSDGKLKLIAWGISSTGNTVQRLGDSGAQAGGIEGNSLASLVDGVVSAIRTDDGKLKLIAWEIDANGAILRRSDSGQQAGTASLIDVLAVTGVADVTMVTCVRTASGKLKLIGWGPAGVRLHVKIVQAPNIPVSEMVAAMTQVYASVGIEVNFVSTENLNLPAMFLDVDVGSCAGSTTTEQEQLFANRNNVGDDDVVAYFVRTTIPPLNGCASHPAGRPSVVVAVGATRWTLGHEVGHVLGLNHVNDNNRLMTGNGTGNITNPPPDLVPSEASTMQSSRLTVPL